MSEDFFRGFVKDLKDPDISMADDGLQSAEFSGYIDTGSYILNAAISGSLYGGVPDNKVTGFAGESATGKTFFVLGLMKKFLEDNPTGGVIYYDTEAAVTKEMMTSRGIDTKRVVIVEPVSVQQFRTIATKMLDNYLAVDKKLRPPMLMVLDSLGMLSTTKELEDIASGKEARDMTRAQVIRGAFRALTLKLAKAKVALLITNHVYEVVGAYIPTKEVSGGGGFKFAASSICMLTKSKDRDEKTKQVVGNIIKITMHKSRLTKELCKAEVLLNFDTGLDRYYGLLPLAEKYGIFHKIGNKYQIWGKDSEMKPVFESWILKNPDKAYRPEIMEQLEEAAQKEFNYGSGQHLVEELDDEE